MSDISPEKWSKMKTRRKLYSITVFLISIGLGYFLFTSGLSTLLVALAAPVLVGTLLWICPRTPPDAVPEPMDAPAASEAPPLPIKKRIILFSDGTGNSSARLFKTNVWRMYQSIDFGYIESGEAMQIGCYTDGVGNSSFKPLAILGGIFGLGLRRNVVHLYRFLCRNYQPGDEIFVFGFSRGAFTVRILTALIAARGVLTDYRNEGDLKRLSNQAYREFIRDNTPDSFPWITISIRFIRDLCLRFYDWIIDPDRPEPAKDWPEVEFVGVWDTVGAYGGPIIEITRGIDQWVAPLSMTDYMLSGKVKMARHALALDDERASFRPLVWDEVHESEQRRLRGELIEKQKDGDLNEQEKEKLVEVKNFQVDRIKQVWFSGMHADVGGGYPDESLSYVSLLWMVDELGNKLQFLPREVERLRNASNIFGPIHNSRTGMGAYYRYQPRKISAFMHHGGSKEKIGRTLSHRDPVVTFPKKKLFRSDKEREHRGLLTQTRIHASALVRIAAGTDNYAPIGFPKNFVVEGTAEAMNNQDEARWNAKIARLRTEKPTADRAVGQEKVWDLVGKRRVVYFTTLLLTILFLVMPVWPEWMSGLSGQLDERWVGGIAANLLSPILPDFAKYWIAEFEQQPVVFLGLLGTIIALLFIGSGMELYLRDRTLSMWRAAMDRPAKGMPPPERLRHKYLLQRAVQLSKWSLVPNLLGIIAISLVGYVVLIIGVQTWMVYAERDGSLCGIGNAIQNSNEPVYLVQKTCNDIGYPVISGKSYEITFQTESDNQDAITAALNGVSVWDFSNAKKAGEPTSFSDHAKLFLAAPFRRMVPAKWLQPLYLTRKYSKTTPRADSEKVGDDISMKAIKFNSIKKRGTKFSAKAVMKAADSGRLFLFANDSAFSGLDGLPCKIVTHDVCALKFDVTIKPVEGGN